MVGGGASPVVCVEFGTHEAQCSEAGLFAPPQPDLFAAAAPEAALPPVDPLGELRALLVKVERVSVVPWASPTAAMLEEHRALWLARQADDEGARLAAAIFDETERLFSASE